MIKFCETKILWENVSCSIFFCCVWRVMLLSSKCVPYPTITLCLPNKMWHTTSSYFYIFRQRSSNFWRGLGHMLCFTFYPAFCSFLFFPFSNPFASYIFIYLFSLWSTFIYFAIFVFCYFCIILLTLPPLFSPFIVLHYVYIFVSNTFFIYLLVYVFLFKRSDSNLFFALILRVYVGFDL